MNIELIGLYGPSRAGKDETAKILVQNYGFEQRAMAAGIREILLGLNPIVKDNGGVVWELLDLFDQHHGDWDRIKAACSESVDYMIRLGQVCRDVMGEGIWLDRVLNNVSEGDRVVISDVRQPNEFDAIKARGGLIWKVTRPGLIRRGMDGLLDDRQFDFHIENIGSLTDLRGQVQAAIAAKYESDTVRGKGHGH